MGEEGANPPSIIQRQIPLTSNINGKEYVARGAGGNFVQLKMNSNLKDFGSEQILIAGKTFSNYDR